MLTTFQLVYKDKVISPTLTTIREYGSWFEDTFDKYTAQLELYMKSKKKDGESVLEWHPGTRIGDWFDKTEVKSNNFKSWYIYQDSDVMQRLVKLKLAEQKDAIPISVNDVKGRKLLRVYTIDQIELYIRSTINKSFDIHEFISTPKQVVVTDMSKLIKTEVSNQKRKLF